MRLEKFPSHFHYGGNSIRKPGAGVGEEVGEGGGRKVETHKRRFRSLRASKKIAFNVEKAFDKAFQASFIH